MEGDTFHLSCSNHRKMIFDLLTKGQKNLEYADVKIRADGETASAHKFILGTVSPFLKELLNTSHAECIIVMDDTSYDDLRLALQFVYNGEIYTSARRGQRIGEVLQRLGISLNKKTEPSTSSRDSSLSRSTADQNTRVRRPSSSYSSVASGTKLQPVVALERLEDVSSKPDSSKFFCRKCRKAYDVKWHLETHEMAGCNQYPVQCTECDDDCGDYIELSLHRAYHFGNNICPFCNDTFSSRHHLKMHFLSKHLPAEYLVFKCTLCTKKFHSEISLSKHINSLHKKRVEQVGKSSPSVLKTYSGPVKRKINNLHKNEISCPECQKCLPNNWTLDAHLETKCETAFPNCKTCLEGLGSFREYIEHKGRHINSFVCPICQHQVERKEMLRGHIFNNHLPLDLLTYKCTSCSKTFFTPYSRKTHIKKVHKSSKIVKASSGKTSGSVGVALAAVEESEVSDDGLKSLEPNILSEPDSCSEGEAPMPKKSKFMADNEYGELKKKLKCIYCKREFDHQNGLNGHYRHCNIDCFFYAADNKRHLCKFCNRVVFKQSLHLQNCIPLQAAVKDKMSKDTLTSWRKSDSASAAASSSLSDATSDQSLVEPKDAGNIVNCPCCKRSLTSTDLNAHVRDSNCKDDISKFYTVLKNGVKRCLVCGWKWCKSKPFISHLKFCKQEQDLSIECPRCKCNMSTSDNIKRHLLICRTNEKTRESADIETGMDNGASDLVSETVGESLSIAVTRTQDTFKCFVCEKLLQRGEFVQHLKTDSGCSSDLFYTYVNDKGIVKCNMCGWKLARHTDFPRHILQTCLVVDQYDGTTECTVCEITLSKKIRNMHYREKHGIVPDNVLSPNKSPSVSGNEVKCRICLTTHSSISKLREHQKNCSYAMHFIEKEENSYECIQCHQLKTKSQRSFHISICIKPSGSTESCDAGDSATQSPSEIRCLACLQKFLERRQLFEHHKSCGRDKVMKKISKTYYECLLCNATIHSTNRSSHLGRCARTNKLGLNADRVSEPGLTDSSLSTPVSPAYALELVDPSRQYIHKCGACYKEFKKFHEAVIHRKLCYDNLFTLSADGHFMCRYCEKAVSSKMKTLHFEGTACPNGTKVRLELIRAARDGGAETSQEPAAAAVHVKSELGREVEENVEQDQQEMEVVDCGVTDEKSVLERDTMAFNQLPGDSYAPINREENVDDAPKQKENVSNVASHVLPTNAIEAAGEDNAESLILNNYEASEVAEAETVASISKGSVDTVVTSCVAKVENPSPVPSDVIDFVGSE